METEHLFEFCELARRLNFTETAKALNMAQPTLSGHVRALEKRCGVRLIERAGRSDPARLTPAGRQFLEYAEQIVAMSDQMSWQLRQLACANASTLTVQLPRTMHGYVAAMLTAGFQSMGPEASLQITYDGDAGMTALREGRADCALGLGIDDSLEQGLVPRGLASQPVRSFELCAWVDRDGPLGAREALRPHDLDGQSIVMPTCCDDACWRQGVEGIVCGQGITAKVVDRFATSMGDFALTRIRPGEVALLSGLEARAGALSVRAERVVRPFLPPTRTVLAVVYRPGNDNPALHAFLDLLARKAS